MNQSRHSGHFCSSTTSGRTAAGTDTGGDFPGSARQVQTVQCHDQRRSSLQGLLPGCSLFKQEGIDSNATLIHLVHDLADPLVQ